MPPALHCAAAPAVALNHVATLRKSSMPMLLIFHRLLCDSTHKRKEGGEERCVKRVPHAWFIAFIATQMPRQAPPRNNCKCCCRQ